MQPFHKKLDLSFYLVLDPSITRRRSPCTIAEWAIRGGINGIQLREKNCSNEEFVSLARSLVDLLKSRSIPLIINDRIDVARQVGAQGVHLGQSDAHWSEARRTLGPDAIVGLSVENLGQALDARSARVDYLGVSSVFRTPTKHDIKHIWGLDGLRELRSLTSHYLVGIGGIDQHNAQSVLNAGADSVALVSALVSAQDPLSIARQIRSLIDQTRANARRKAL